MPPQFATDNLPVVLVVFNDKDADGSASPSSRRLIDRGRENALAGLILAQPRSRPRSSLATEP